MAKGLFGNYYVVPTGSAVRDACKLFPRYGDYQKARRHALKLAYWPTGDDPNGMIQDLDWCWVVALQGKRVGELRISDKIGGKENLRVIFHVAAKKLPKDSLPRIWTISVLDKKSQHFTSNDLESFRGRLTIVRKRHYDC